MSFFKKRFLNIRHFLKNYLKPRFIVKKFMTKFHFSRQSFSVKKLFFKAYMTSLNSLLNEKGTYELGVMNDGRLKLSPVRVKNIRIGRKRGLRLSSFVFLRMVEVLFLVRYGKFLLNRIHVTPSTIKNFSFLSIFMKQNSLQDEMFTVAQEVKLAKENTFTLDKKPLLQHFSARRALNSSSNFMNSRPE